MPTTRVLLLGFALIGASVCPSAAEDSAAEYPDRQVTFVVPFAPGGGTDILARLLGQKLSERFGKPFVIENRPGAGTVTAAVQVAKSTADGYTIMMATSGTMAKNQTLYKKLSYRPNRDLVLVALICHVPFVLVVNPALPVHSVADLVKLAQERPLSYGSGGAGAFHHLMGELFKTSLGIPMTHVPYKGTLPALNDVIAGHIQLMFSDLAPAYPLIQAGKVRALGVTTAQRAPAAPEIPPLAEVGVPGFDWAAWQSVAAPGGTPKEILAKLNGAATRRTSVHPDRQRIAGAAGALRGRRGDALGQGAGAGGRGGVGVAVSRAARRYFADMTRRAIGAHFSISSATNCANCSGVIACVSMASRSRRWRTSGRSSISATALFNRCVMS